MREKVEIARSRQLVTRSSPSGRDGAVAAARKPIVDAATAVLSEGGNAVDAAVAAAFVAGVIQPMETTLAGSGFMLVHEPKTQQVTSVEFAPRAPGGATPDMFEPVRQTGGDSGLGLSAVADDENVLGAKACGVPGTIGGLLAAHRRFGRSSRQRVLLPAVEAAYDGFLADSYYALEVLAHLDALRRDPGASAVFLQDGMPPVPAHLGAATLGSAPSIRQPDLGRTLESLAENGEEAFYKGEIGRSFVQTVTEAGGLLSNEDLASYRPAFARPLHIAFRGTDVWAPSAPSGGVTELQMLRMWEAWTEEELPAGSAAWFLALAEIGWHAFADRYYWLADQDFVPVPLKGLLSEGYARHVVGLIRDGADSPRHHLADGPPWEVFAAMPMHDPWTFDPQGGPKPDWTPAWPGAVGGTTHVSVIDGEGMAVSCTHTAAQHFGAKIVCPRTGLLLDATMGWFNAIPGAANSIAPGKRALANMGPLLATRDGKASAAIGAPGGRRIIHALVQVLIGLLDRGLTAQEALEEPRIDASGPMLIASDRIDADLLEMLREKGLPLTEVNEEHAPHLYELARPLAVTANDGMLRAGADPFTEGYAVAF
jgi:gamma-glutamyltranspeptidase/glutathione hydrolase